MITTVFLVFVVLLILCVPIGGAILAACLAASLVNPAFTANASYVFRTMAATGDSFVLLAIPLFVLSGNLMAKGGISDRLFNFFAYFVGNKTAGLPAAVVISCLFYGAISGSGPATVAAIGAMTIPLLVSLGYEKSFVTALVAVAGGLGVIIPPSIPFVMYGVTAGVSVADLFIAGVLPGILIGVFLILGAYIMCKHKGEDKLKLQANYEQLRSKGFFKLFKESFLALLCPVIILGGIYSGFFTPTEAACVSVFYSLIVSCFIYRTMKLKDILEALYASVDGMVAMLFVCGAANAFGRILALMKVPQLVTAALTSAFSSKFLLLLVINLFLLVVGMLMDAVSAILICTPLLLPVVTAIGYNPVQFGVMMTVNLAIGFVTPPVGVNLFVASNMAKIPVPQLAKKALPFIGLFLIALLLITFVPQLSLLFV